MIINEYSNKGGRSRNEDYTTYKCLSDSKVVFVVADGMGGYKNGDIAARTVAMEIVRYVEKNISNCEPKKLLRDAIHFANDALFLTRLEFGGEPMGAVVVILLISGDNAYLSWLGDSRGYLFRNKKELFCTKDHSLINELSPTSILNIKQREQLGHIVTQALMGDALLVESPIEHFHTQPKDVFILCTDGLYKGLSIDYAIEYQPNKEELLDNLSITASDNYSFIKVEI